jgi:alcohol dehydrogenase
MPQKCQSLFKYGHERLDEARPLSGGLAEYCLLVPGTTIVALPDRLSDEAACPAGCATATTAAAFRAAGGCRDAAVLVQGAGALGLTACAMARARGAKQVIACDIDDDRLSMARRFGATSTVNVANGVDELEQCIREASEGRGVDLAFEMSGAPGAFQVGVELLRTGGDYALVGAVMPSAPEPLLLEHVIRRLLTIRGIHNYAPQDLATAVEFLDKFTEDFPFTDLVADRFPLSAAEAAFKCAMEGQAIRVAVGPEG